MAVLTRSQPGSKPGKKVNIPDENADRTAFYADRPVMDATQDAYGFQVYATQFALLINDPLQGHVRRRPPVAGTCQGRAVRNRAATAHLASTSIRRVSGGDTTKLNRDFAFDQDTRGVRLSSAPASARG